MENLAIVRDGSKKICDNKYPNLEFSTFYILLKISIEIIKRMNVIIFHFFIINRKI